MENLPAIYKARFNTWELKVKDQIWQVLCRNYFQQFIREDSTVLEIACGAGEFIRNIRAKRKYAVDLNPDSAGFLSKDIRFFHGSAQDLTKVITEPVDHIFVSNFFEHLPNTEALNQVLQQALRVLKPGGTLIALHPNIRYVGHAFWDFSDHHLPISHLSVSESFENNGFQVMKLVPKFIPYSTKSALPKAPWIVAWYLRLPFLWYFFGKQFVIVGQRPQAQTLAQSA